MKNLIIAVIAIPFLFGCNSKNKNKETIDTLAYKNEIDSWHQGRINSLKSHTGYLNLAGLFWLKDGINSFGSDPDNDIVFPEKKIASKAGYFLLKDSVVSISVLPNVKIFSMGKPVTKMVIFSPDSSSVPTLEIDSLSWFVIKRLDKFGIRLRDFNNIVLKEFKGIERFPVDAKWRFKASFVDAPIGRTIAIQNILGQTEHNLSPGTLEFNINGKPFHLDVIDENAKDLFIVFGDLSNGKSTYGGGRFVYVERPDSTKTTWVDFNKAINPPCSLTSFTTCPKPPEQNILDVEINAGEKKYEKEY